MIECLNPNCHSTGFHIDWRKNRTCLTCGQTVVAKSRKRTGGRRRNQRVVHGSLTPEQLLASIGFR